MASLRATDYSLADLNNYVQGQNLIDESWVRPGWLGQILQDYNAVQDPETGVIMRAADGNQPDNLTPAYFKGANGNALIIKNGQVVDTGQKFQIGRAHV